MFEDLKYNVVNQYIKEPAVHLIHYFQNSVPLTSEASKVEIRILWYIGYSADSKSPVLAIAGIVLLISLYFFGKLCNDL
jgi:hypothetical protein